MGLIAKSTFALDKITQWTGRESEYEKRAGFTTMAAYCMANKLAENSEFKEFFTLVKREAKDGRIYVKKAVNWALRNIGKRNSDLNKMAIQTANELLELNDPTANWIARNALLELEKPNKRMSDYPREIYRN